MANTSRPRGRRDVPPPSSSGRRVFNVHESASRSVHFENFFFKRVASIHLLL
jgi:hypothetical protein